jgi:hypothetical protein
MNPLRFASHWLLWSTLTNCSQQLPTPLAEVQIYVPGTDGRPLPYKVHEFFNIGLRKPFEAHFLRGLEGRKIPYGRYRYTLVRTDARRPSISNISGEIEIDQPQKWISAFPPGVIEVTESGDEVILDFEPPRPIRVLGQFSSLPHLSGRRWVKLIDLTRQKVSEVPINNDGNFLILGALPGWHLVVLMDDGQVMQAEPLMVRPNQSDVILSIQYRASRPGK